MAKKKKESDVAVEAPAARKESHLLYLAVLFAAFLIFYFQPLFSPDTSIQWDAVDVHYSSQKYFADSVHAGKLPFWTPYIFSGFPFLADPQVGAWYPLNWPFFLAGITPKAIEAELFLHALIAGFGAYLLAFLLWKNRMSGLVAGLLYGLSGFFAGHSSHVGIFQTAALFPWLLSGLLAACRDRGWARYAGLTGLLAGCMMLAGHFQTSLYAFVGMPLFAAALVIGKEAAWKRAVIVLAVVAGLAVLVSAMQTVPAVELARQSIRADMKASEHTEGVLPVGSLVTLIWPNAYGVFDDKYKGPEDITQYYFYSGILLLPLAAWGMRDRRAMQIALVLALPCLWYAAGPGLGLYSVISHLPGFASVRAPVHIWFVPMLALAMAASSAVGNQNRTRVMVLAAVIFADLFYWNSVRNPLAYARNSFEDLYGKGEDLIGQKVKPTVPELTRFHGALQNATFGSLNHPLDVQLETTYGYNPLKLRRYDEYLQAAQSNPKLLNGLNVSRELDAGKGAVVDRAGLPRVYFARRSAATAGKEGLRDLDPADTVFVEGAPAMAQDPAASAQITAYTGSSYGVRAKTASASYLTFSVPSYPGWVATVDGKPSPVVRANHALMAVLVPAGEHLLTLDYRPDFLPGLLLSFAGLLISAALFTKRTHADVDKEKSTNSR